jgi:hypothetical protein
MNRARVSTERPVSPQSGGEAGLSQCGKFAVFANTQVNTK